jgi:hypothetical protein
MPTIVHCHVPAADFALAETFQTVPELSVVCDQRVASPNDDPFPLLWVTPPDRAAVETALANDPTVATYTHCGESGPAHRYRIEWTAQVRSVVELLTQADGRIRDAAGATEGWQVRLVYPDREALRTIHETCTVNNISLDIQTIRTVDDEPTPPPWARGHPNAVSHTKRPPTPAAISMPCISGSTGDRGLTAGIGRYLAHLPDGVRPSEAAAQST